MEKKMTNKEFYELIKTRFEDMEDVIAFCDGKIESINKKSEKAKEAAALKKAEGDELSEAIKNALTGEYQTLAELSKALDSTPSKISARINKIDGVEKTKIKDGKRSITAYKLA